jgi:hypothetical protein
MSGIIFIAAAGIFVIGIGVGIILMVSHGIHREQRRFDEDRRYREERGIWTGADSAEYFLPEAPDGVSNAARRLNGLYVRHFTDIHGYDTDLAVRA